MTSIQVIFLLIFLLSDYCLCGEEELHRRQKRTVLHGGLGIGGLGLGGLGLGGLGYGGLLGLGGHGIDGGLLNGITGGLGGAEIAKIIEVITVPAPATEPPATEPPATEAPSTAAPAPPPPPPPPPAPAPAPPPLVPTTFSLPALIPITLSAMYSLPAPAPSPPAPAPESPATEAPATEAPATEAPATEAPATEAPAPEPESAPAPAPVSKNYITIQQTLPFIVGRPYAVPVKVYHTVPKPYPVIKTVRVNVPKPYPVTVERVVPVPYPVIKKVSLVHPRTLAPAAETKANVKVETSQITAPTLAPFQSFSAPSYPVLPKSSLPPFVLQSLPPPASPPSFLGLKNSLLFGPKIRF